MPIPKTKPASLLATDHLVCYQRPYQNLDQFPVDKDIASNYVFRVVPFK